MARTWLEPAAVAVPSELISLLGAETHPLAAQLLARRGFVEAGSARAFLDPVYYAPASPMSLPGMQAAVERIELALQRGEPVCVWGDFDVDGQTSTALLVSALRGLGLQVVHHIPVRATESHGVKVAYLAQVLDQGIRLIVTCDTGISAHEAVDYARWRGVDVVITDHHDLPAELPAAHAIVNPKLLPDRHPLSTLPGVGVAYKLVEALYARARQPEACLAYLDLVALGIVADVAQQTGDTRYLLQRGLIQLRRVERLGLKVLMQTADLNPEGLTEEHIGFTLAPRLNALGRVGDANGVVDFFLTDDLVLARTFAVELEGLNARRKLLSEQVFRGALAQLDREPALLEEAALVLAHPDWPGGVLGLVANRLVERYHKPVVLLTAPPGEMARGSARSVEGCNITACIAANAALVAGFGGHPMAAGLSLDAARIPDFRRALSQAVQAMLGPARAEAPLDIDGYLPLADLTLDLVRDLERLAPFGPGNPAPVLATRGLTVASRRAVGRESEHLVVMVEDSQGRRQDVIWWNGAGWPLPDGPFDLAYGVRAATYRGERSVQVEWVDARWESAEAAMVTAPAKTIAVVDWRGDAQPRARLEALLATGDVAVWREAEAAEAVPGSSRHDLAPAQTLVIWTAPPGPDELQQAVQAVSPETVYVIGVDPQLDRPEAFLKRLAGLVKHALAEQGGKTSLARLAAAMAHREATIRAGLRWLQARGHIRLVQLQGEAVELAAGDRAQEPDLGSVELQLKALLDEAAAYRAYFARIDAQVLLQID